MSDDEKMLHIGYWSIGTVFFLTVLLGAMSRTQNREINHVRRNIVKTQQEIANVLGISQTMYARYERGANELPIRHLIVLCKYYGVTSDYFLMLNNR